MSKHAKQARATTRATIATDTDPHSTDVQYVPDYGARCSSCGETPCVNGMKNGKVVMSTGLCGPCCFGDAEATDPDAW